MQRRNRGQALRTIAVGVATAAGAGAAMYLASNIPGVTVNAIQTLADIPYHAANLATSMSSGYDVLAPWGFRAIGDSFNYVSSGVRSAYNNASPAVDWVFGGAGALIGGLFAYDLANNNLP